jgi:hypothetical protein
MEHGSNMIIYNRTNSDSADFQQLVTEISIAFTISSTKRPG